MNREVRLITNRALPDRSVRLLKFDSPDLVRNSGESEISASFQSFDSTAEFLLRSSELQSLKL